MSKLPKLILGRIGLGAVTLMVVSMLIFVGVELLPGDIAQQILGQSATAETVAAFRLELGLDQPAYVRYFSWVAGVLHGDFGHSLANGATLPPCLHRAWPRRCSWLAMPP